jgi:hypothetical protein
MPQRLIPILLLLCIAARPAGAQSRNVTIDKRPPEVTRKTFDPDKPPNPPPPLHENEIAACETVFHIDLTPRYTPGDSRPNPGAGVRVLVRIDSVNVRLRFQSTIWIPKDAPPRVRPHEEAHRTIGETVYKDAHKHAQAAAQLILGKSFDGEGTTREIAIRDALQKAANPAGQAYMDNTKTPNARLQELFDEITDFGRSPDPPPEKAVGLAFERYKEEQKKEN